MTHILSTKHHEQFMKEAGIPRFTMANGRDGKECTLLIKAPTLLLRFLIKHQKFKVLAAKLPNYPLLWYGIRVEDDPTNPFTLWSIVEDENELEALKTFFSDGKCFLFLFNEGTINVAWAEIFCTTDVVEAKALFENSRFLLAIDSNSVMKVAKKLVNDLHESDPSPPHLVAAPAQNKPIEWHEISNNFIAENAVSSLNILSGIEGAQQEELIFWILNSVVPGGAYINTQVKSSKGAREFTDALLIYNKSVFLFESKALSIYERVDAPDRKKLTRAIEREIKKASKQLVRSLRALKGNKPITQKDGNILTIPRNIPPHCVIVVPDLSLLSDGNDLGRKLVGKFMAEQKTYLHVVDPPELLGAVFSMNRLLTKNPGLARGEAFDFVLLRRWEKSLDQTTPDFRYHLLTSPEEIPPHFEDQ